MRKFSIAAILLAFFSFANSQDQAWQQKIDPVLLSKIAHGTTSQFLVLLAQQADLSPARQLRSKEEKATFVFNALRQKANQTQADLKAFLFMRHVAFESIFIVNAIKTEGNLDLINELAQRPEVSKILDNGTVHYAEPTERLPDSGIHERAGVEWGIDMMNADDVWAMGYTGQGVTVGGQDTGYDWTHPAIQSKYRGYDAATQTADHNYNWHDAIHSISPLSGSPDNPCGLDSPVPCDDNSHGTHTMGTMVGSDTASQIGVAPDANWCACRNMERGNGSPFTYLECFQWFLAPTDLSNQNPDPTKAPHVINNSWYCSEQEGCNPSNYFVMSQAVTNLRMAGTVVVVSAGNSGSGCGSISAPPAIFENSFSVGATAINDTIAGFSSRGPVSIDGSNRLKPNVSAPGVNVRSSIPGGGFANFSGTSMAGPHVAGLVALIISANPDLAGKVDTIENIIEQTAVPKTTDQNCGNIPGTQVPNNTYGYGRVDALAAVEAALALIPPPPSGTEEQVKASIQVFPNPVERDLNILVKNAVGELQFELFSVSGSKVLNEKWEAANGVHAVDLAAQTPGIYLYRILSGNGVVQGKVVKQ